MKSIPVSGGKYHAIIDDEDYPIISQHTRYALVCDNAVYAATHLTSRKQIQMHRLIMNAPAHMEVDHKDGNGLFNRRLNLRLATKLENRRNKRNVRPHSSPNRFVVPYRIWATQIGYGTTKRLGCYADEHIAALMYDFWALQLFGSYANTNFNIVSHNFPIN